MLHQLSRVNTCAIWRLAQHFSEKVGNYCRYVAFHCMVTQWPSRIEILDPFQ